MFETPAGGTLALVVGCCFAGAAQGAAERVVVITPHTEAIRTEFRRAFDEWHQQQYGSPAVVEWRDLGGTSDALKFVQSEFARKPEGIGVDCFFGGGLEPLLLLSDRKLSQPHRPPANILDGIPQNLNGMDIYDRAGLWHGVVLSSFGILQNTHLQEIARLPKVARWEDLAQPRLAGWVGAGDPRNSGTMNVMFEAFLQARGWEDGWGLLTQIGGNCRKFDRLSSSTAKDVTLGETAYGFAIDFYGLAQVAAGGLSNLTFLLPRDFAAMNPDGICLLKGAPNPVVAGRFVDFLLSDTGQSLWFLPKGHPGGPKQNSLDRMPVRPEMYRRYAGVTRIQHSPFDLEQRFLYDSKLGRDRRDLVAALAGALLVDTHPELQRAWRAMIRRGLTPESLRRLGAAPISEAEGLQLAAGAWKDPAVRNQKKIEWQRWALEKYRRLRESYGP